MIRERAPKEDEEDKEKRTIHSMSTLPTKLASFVNFVVSPDLIVCFVNSAPHAVEPGPVLRVVPTRRTSLQPNGSRS